MPPRNDDPYFAGITLKNCKYYMELGNKLLNYNSNYPAEINNKIKMLEFLNNYKNPFSRELAIGHFTASAFLLNSDKTKFLLMHHNKLNKWIQLGGHCNGDSDVLAVAIKEAKEESGIEEIEPISTEIYDLDIHYIPERHQELAHYHYDVRFLLKTIDNDNFVKNDEASELRWIEFSSYSLKDFSLEESVTRMIEKYQKMKSKIEQVNL
ncbi:NUDIX hydrolase [Rickettsia endosymbiont of Orchestes rusci]|uniref:NUDIX hydrolase n=1 Tax=Rickettsia endosymbiont of Orchestes rusci TaxID=3066250 RepID=UPI00313AF7E2